MPTVKGFDLRPEQGQDEEYKHVRRLRMELASLTVLLSSRTLAAGTPGLDELRKSLNEAVSILHAAVRPSLGGVSPHPRQTGVAENLHYQLESFTRRLQSCTLDAASESVEALRQTARGLPMVLETRIRYTDPDVDLSAVPTGKLLEQLMIRSAGGKRFGTITTRGAVDAPETEPLPGAVVYFCQRCNKRLGTCECGEQNAWPRL